MRYDDEFGDLEIVRNESDDDYGYHPEIIAVWIVGVMFVGAVSAAWALASWLAQ